MYKNRDDGVVQDCGEGEANVTIDIENLDELLYWTARLGCTSAELRAAVRTVGPSLTAVRHYLRQHRYG